MRGRSYLRWSTRAAIGKSAFRNLFSCPLLAHVWPDSSELNAELRQKILEHAAQHSREQRTNHGGWHSRPGALEFCGAAGEPLIRQMRQTTEEATLCLYTKYNVPREQLNWTLNAWEHQQSRATSTRSIHGPVRPGRGSIMRIVASQSQDLRRPQSICTIRIQGARTSSSRKYRCRISSRAA